MNSGVGPEMSLKLTPETPKWYCSSCFFLFSRGSQIFQYTKRKTAWTDENSDFSSDLGFAIKDVCPKVAASNCWFKICHFLFLRCRFTFLFSDLRFAAALVSYRWALKFILTKIDKKIEVSYQWLQMLVNWAHFFPNRLQCISCSNECSIMANSHLLHLPL